jgi:hypothetical protein
MTPQRDHKRVQRALRTIPMDAPASAIAACEASGDALWRLVNCEPSLVSPRGGGSETTWDDPVEYALFVRWLQAHPERVHQTFAEAQAFVRSKLQNKSEANRGPHR